jgi:hypothetical protein
MLQDALTAIRLGVPVHRAGDALHPNAERHLRPPSRLAQIYPPQLLDETLHIAARCNFSLDSLRYEYPDEIVPSGHSAMSYLRQLTEAGLVWRFPRGVPVHVRDQVEHELKLISDLHYEHFFLTVHDLVQFARTERILHQGRGSAANSAVCYCLGITEVDPSRTSMLFERFISRERNEPPDIDVDFEHQRREEVIQYVYRKYGRERAPYRGEDAERENVHFEQPQRVQIVLVPLDYRALGHGGIFERHEMRERAARNDETAHVLRKVPGKADQLVHEAQKTPDHRAIGIHTRRAQACRDDSAAIPPGE